MTTGRTRLMGQTQTALMLCQTRTSRVMKQKNYGWGRLQTQVADVSSTCLFVMLAVSRLAMRRLMGLLKHGASLEQTTNSTDCPGVEIGFLLSEARDYPSEPRYGIHKDVCFIHTEGPIRPQNLLDTQEGCESRICHLKARRTPTARMKKPRAHLTL